MALTWTLTKSRRIGNLKMVTGTVAFDSSYPTGGEEVAVGDLGMVQDIEMISFGTAGGYVPTWDNTNSKIKVYYGNYDAADGVLIDVPNETNISALSAVPFIAFGR